MSYNNILVLNNLSTFLFKFYIILTTVVRIVMFKSKICESQKFDLEY